MMVGSDVAIYTRPLPLHHHLRLLPQPPALPLNPSLPPNTAHLQAAVEEGIVPGGGTALVYASRTLESVKDKCENFDQKVSLVNLHIGCV